ncbi:hypothetical protein Q0Z83_002160 [Actinoplanes sichuanensis]|nr:hypothetical protein [Actinoplanes sichuanensis]BEL02025.1 hypothetical protein Q0Z83_002160 [Actinoplanes sichuanensis]
MRPILLSGYAAKSCARAVHNAYDPTVPRPEVRVTPEMQALFDAGVDFETEVLDMWAALDLPGYVDLRDLDGDKHVHIGATIGAMRAGAAIIVGGRLPDDHDGARTGKPDILLRDDDRGYHPADIKAHHVLDRKHDNAPASTLKAPAWRDAVPLPDGGARHREEDLLQLAHYWRMLEACGHAAGQPRGAICGTDRPGDPILIWYDLSAPAFRTFSRTGGVATRSALERYDHEHGFRRRIADAARQRRGAPDDPAPLVEPIGQEECAGCRWAPVCVDTLPAGDLSAELRGALGVREYLALRAAGVHTVDDLAAEDPAELLAGLYGGEVGHLRTRAFRLRKAVTAAQLARDGLIVRRRDGRDLPYADVEVDIDVEWGADDVVYLWGCWSPRRASPRTPRSSISRRPTRNVWPAPAWTTWPPSRPTPPPAAAACSSSTTRRRSRGTPAASRRCPTGPPTRTPGSTCCRWSGPRSTPAPDTASRSSPGTAPGTSGATPTPAGCNPKPGMRRPARAIRSPPGGCSTTTRTTYGRRAPSANGLGCGNEPGPGHRRRLRAVDDA